MSSNKYFLAFLIQIHLFKVLFAICLSGYYYSANKCIACPDGHYCTGNSDSPIPCPVGTYSYNSTGGIAQCIECKLGYYANETASTSCKACPDGYFCSDPSLSPTPCPKGTYSIGGLSECTKCDLGYYADKTASTKCTACPGGNYCCNPSLPPTPCPIGTYSSNAAGGIYECKSCPSGSYSNVQGSTYCQPCQSCQNNPAPPKCLSDESSVKQSINDIQCSDKDLSCLANNGNCLFYDELENIKKCGSNGYMLNYGKKYCIKFADKYDKFNDDGKLWVNSVRKCLMHKLLNNNMNCNDLKTYAFSTHVDCYLNPGYNSKNICDVWYSGNNMGALWDVYDLKDFFSSFTALSQVFQTMKKCLGSYVN